MFRRLFNAAVPNVEYLTIPEAFVVFLNLESLHSSWTCETAHKTQALVWIKPNQTDSNRVPLGRDLPVYNFALSPVWRASGMCYSNTGAVFCRSRLASLQHVPRQWKGPGPSQNISYSCVISRYGPCASHVSPYKKRLIQQWKFHFRGTADLTVNINYIN